MCVAKGKEVICDLVRENEKEITNFGTFLFKMLSTAPKENIHTLTI